LTHFAATDKIRFNRKASSSMNEPPNPPSPSDPTPPPPPPPPFTPPPAPEPPTPPAPSAPPPPRPPVYAPPPGPPQKKSALPWVLGGCGCLTLLIIIAVVIAMMAYRAKQRVTELKTDLKTDFKSALKAIDEKESKTSRAGWITYTNVKSNLPASLQSNFIAFSFDYPKSFELQPQSDVNFVKVEKYAAAGKGNTAENFAVGYARFNDPTAQSDALYNSLLDQLGQQLAGGFHNYKELRRTSETIDGVNSRAALFQADFNDAAKTMIYGKTIVVHPPGKTNGVTILILGTSLSRDVKSPGDLGTKGDTADIIRSFRFL
jgi:hypothetical protein